MNTTASCISLNQPASAIDAILQTNVSPPHARERTLGRVDGKFVVNPSPDSFSPTAWNDGGGFDLLYAANEHRVLMIEMGGGPTGERLMDSALRLAHKHVSKETRARGRCLSCPFSHVVRGRLCNVISPAFNRATGLTRGPPPYE